MRILGIDPGSSRCGYGFIEKQGSKLSFIKAGLLEIKEKDANQKLLCLAKDFKRLLETENPELVVIERLYFSKNVKTAIEVAQARGILILETLKRALPLVEYSPQEIKQAVTNYGAADKKAVAKMVSILLNQPIPEKNDDVSDAIAVAITAATRMGIN